VPNRAIIWLHGDDVTGRQVFEEAFRERGWSGREVPVEIVDGPVHYLAGEAQAITRAVSGGPALPFPRRAVTDPYAPQTIVHNVETLARLALIARELPNPSTRLLTVLGAQRMVVEVEQSTTVEQVLIRLGWKVAPQAVLLGGYAGIWAKWDDVAGLQVAEKGDAAGEAHAGRRRDGAARRRRVRRTGHVRPRHVPGVDERAAVRTVPVRHAGPGRALDEAGRRGRLDRRTIDRLRSDIAAVEGRGGCRHPDGATRLSKSALETFSAHLGAHVSGMRCRHRSYVSLPGTSR
jgi:hypothetical protein